MAFGGADPGSTPVCVIATSLRDLATLRFTIIVTRDNATYLAEACIATPSYHPTLTPSLNAIVTST